MVKLYKDSIFVIAETQFAICHVNLTATKPWRFVPKLKYGSAVEFIIFRVPRFSFRLSTVSNIIIILLSGAVGCNVIGVFRWILAKC